MGGTATEFALLARGAFAAFVPAEVRERLEMRVTLKSHNAFHAGEAQANFKYIEHSAPDLPRVWEWLLGHRPFVGLNWHEGEEADNPYPRARSERLWKAGLEKWGENWRGNWAPQRARFEIDGTALMSAHDQLESRLLLRDFLKSLDDENANELASKL